MNRLIVFLALSRRLPRFTSLDPAPLRAKHTLAHLALASLTWWLQFTTVWPGSQDALSLALPAIDASLVCALEILGVGPLFACRGRIGILLACASSGVVHGNGIKVIDDRVIQRMAQELVVGGSPGMTGFCASGIGGLVAGLLCSCLRPTR